MFSQKHIDQASELLVVLSSENFTLAAAESCTGGLLAGLLTSVSGSSRVFIGGLVAYSNSVKKEQLKIPHSS